MDTDLIVLELDSNATAAAGAPVRAGLRAIHPDCRVDDEHFATRWATV